jgi:hypothetical protein
MSDQTVLYPVYMAGCMSTQNYRSWRASLLNIDGVRAVSPDETVPLYCIRVRTVYTHNLLLLNSAPNLGPLLSHWEINKYENCWYKSVRILQVLKLLFQQCFNLSSSQRDMSGPILGDLSNNRWSNDPTIDLWSTWVVFTPCVCEAAWSIECQRL